MEVQVGDRVIVTNKGEGYVRFKGETEFAPGIVWIGVELDEPKGKNNGSVKDIKYFECAENHGAFVKEDAVQVITAPSRLRAPSTSATESPAPAAVETPVKTVEETSTPQKGAGTPEPKTEASTPVATTPEMTTKKRATMALREKKQALAQKLASKTPAPAAPPTPAVPATPIPAPAAIAPSTPAAPTTTSVGTQKTPSVTPARPSGNDEALQKANEQLTQELAQKNTELQSLKAQVQTKDEEVKAKDSILKTKDDKIEQLTQSVHAEKDAKQALESEMRTLRSKLERNEMEGDVKTTAALAKLERTVENQAKELEELNAMVETLTLDKESLQLDKSLAEEKAEELELEVEKLKLDLEEKELTFQDAANALASQTGGGASSDDETLRATVEENGKLREALKRLHTVSSQEKTDLTKQVKTLTKDNESLKQAADQVETMKKQNAELKEQVEELKSMLDTAQAYESMVEKLSEKNLELADENADLKQANEELEELQQLSEEMEQQNVDNQRELERELAARQTDLNNARIEIERLQGREDSVHDGLEKLKQMVLDSQQREAALQARITELEEVEAQLSSVKNNARSATLALLDETSANLHRKIQLESALSRKDQADFRTKCLEAMVPESLFGVNGKAVLDMLIKTIRCLHAGGLVSDMILIAGMSSGNSQWDSESYSLFPLEITQLCNHVVSNCRHLWSLLLSSKVTFEMLESWTPIFTNMFSEQEDIMGQYVRILKKEDGINLIDKGAEEKPLAKELMIRLAGSCKEYEDKIKPYLVQNKLPTDGFIKRTCFDNLKSLQIACLMFDGEETIVQDLDRFCTILDDLEAGSNQFDALIPQDVVEQVYLLKNNYLDDMDAIREGIVGLRSFFKSLSSQQHQSDQAVFTCTAWSSLAENIRERLVASSKMQEELDSVKSALKKRVMEAHTRSGELASLQQVRNDLEQKLDAAREQAKAHLDSREKIDLLERQLKSKQIEYEQAVEVAREQASQYEVELGELKRRLGEQAIEPSSPTMPNLMSMPPSLKSKTPATPEQQEISILPNNHQSPAAVDPLKPMDVDVSSAGLVRLLQSEITFWKGKAAEKLMSGLEPLRFEPVVRYDGRSVPCPRFRDGENKANLKNAQKLAQEALLAQSKIRVPSASKAPEVSLKQQLLTQRIYAKKIISQIGLPEFDRRPKSTLRKVGRIVLKEVGECKQDEQKQPVLLSYSAFTNLQQAFPLAT